jgi:hypothetical protein
MDAGSIWATATAKIAGKIQYKTLQMDRGAALNCRVVHNWKPEKPATRKQAGKAAKDNSKPDVKAGAADEGADATVPEVVQLQSPEMPEYASEANNVSNDAEIKILAKSASAEAKSKQQPGSGRRLGIFGFVAKAAKLPDASGS